MDRSRLTPRVAVTGATGFVGGAVVRQLVGAGCTVVGIARRPPAERGLFEHEGTSVVDLSGPNAVDELQRRSAALPVDVLVHAAGLAHRHATQVEFEAHNSLATQHVMEWAARASIRRVVMISSASVYEPSMSLLTEASSLAPITAYGRSKLAAERAASSAANWYGIELVILRLATVYGAGDPGNVARLLAAAGRGRIVPLGTGCTRKSLIYVDDASRAIAAVASLGSPVCGIFNLSTGCHELRDIVTAARRAHGRTAPQRWMPVPGQGRVVGWLQRLPASERADATLGRVVRPLRTWLSDDGVDGSRLADALGSDFPEVTPLDVGFLRTVSDHRVRQPRSRST